MLLWKKPKSVVLLFVVLWTLVLARPNKSEKNIAIPNRGRQEENKNDNFIDSTLRGVLGVMESMDNFLRSTLRSYDRFQCVERVLCELMTPDTEETDDLSQLQELFEQLNDNPIFQNALASGQNLNDAAAAATGVEGGGGDLAAAPNLFSGLRPQFQPTGGQEFAASSQFFQPQFQQVPLVHSGFPGADPFLIQQARRADNVTLPYKAQPMSYRALIPELVPPPPSEKMGIVGHRRRVIRVPVRKEKNWIQRILNLRKKRNAEGKNHRRMKRQLFESFFNDWTTQRFMGLLNGLTKGHSFHPYTNAAYQGYTGDTVTCADEFPDCPTTPEEVMDVFNNRHEHFPDGVPFADRLPWPLNIMMTS